MKTGQERRVSGGDERMPEERNRQAAGRSLRDQADRLLMAGVRRGDQLAFAELVRRYQQSLVNFFRRVGVLNDAEDLAQETFLRVYRYRRRYKPVAPFRAFLFRLADQVHIDYLRRQSRRPAAVGLETEPSGAPWVGADEGLEEVERALRRLSAPLRSVVVLRVFNELSYTEIAEALDIPVGTVKSRLFSGLRELRGYFERRAIAGDVLRSGDDGPDQ